jgi:hypothetical protein
MTDVERIIAFSDIIPFLIEGSYASIQNAFVYNNWKIPVKTSTLAVKLAHKTLFQRYTYQAMIFFW